MSIQEEASPGAGIPTLDLSYILNQLGEDRERYFGAVAPPIMQSLIFAFPTVQAMRADFRDEFGSRIYTGGNNPTVEILRRKVAALESAQDCLMFGSGAATISAGVIASVSRAIMSSASPSHIAGRAPCCRTCCTDST